MLYLAILMIFLAAAGSPVQTAINTNMGQYVKHPLLATFISFSVSTILILFLTLATCHTLVPDAETAAGIPWWGWLGGVMGLVGVTLLVVIFPKLGGVQTVLLPMLGMTVTSMVIDNLGLFGCERIPFEIKNLAGLAVVIGGLFLYTSGKSAEQSSGNGGWVYRVLGLVVGVAFAIQPAINGFMTGRLGSAIFASWLSFLESDVLFIILIILIPECRRNARRIVRADEKRPLWVWTAGLCGAFYVLSYSFFTPVVGVALVAVIGVLGQLTSSTFIDKFGLFRSARKTVAARQYAALAVVLAGTVILNL